MSHSGDSGLAMAAGQEEETFKLEHGVEADDC